MSTPQPHTAARVADFVASIGVNTAMSASWTSYGSLARVEAAIAFLGLRNVRDAFVTPNDVYQFRQIASQLGVSFDFHLEPGDLGTDWQIAQIRNNPDLVRFVEGPNEPDVAASTYNGLTGLDAARAEQGALYAAIKGDPVLNGNGRVTPVIQASFAALESFYQTGNWSAVSDYGNAHMYFPDGDQPASSIDAYVTLARMVSPSQTVIASEAGYYTLSSNDGVSQAVQAKYNLNLLFDDWQAGIKMTYLFELLDEEADPININPHSHFGLFDASGAPKLAATALHNLVALLNDTGTTAPPSILSYSIDGLPSGSGHEMLLAKSNGDFTIALWNDVKLWNGATSSEIIVPAVPVTLTLGQTFQSINVFDPLVGTSAVASYSNASQISLSLLDHPVLVQVTSRTSPQLSLLQPVITQSAQAQQSSTNLWSAAMANAQETVAAFASGLTVSAVNVTATRGVVTLNTTTKTLIYTAPVYDPNLTTDRFDYTISDGHGGVGSGTLRIVIAPPPNTIYGMALGGFYAAPAAGWTLYSAAKGQVLFGSAEGQNTFYGLGDTTIAADGTGNVISVAGGNHTIATGLGSAKVTMGDGNNTLFGNGTGDQITGGIGNNTIMGQTGSTIVTLGNGNQAIGLTGGSNSITVGVGLSQIYAGDGGGSTVVVGGGTNQISVGGVGNFVRLKGGTNTVGATGSQSTFQLDGGDNTIYAGGSGNKISGGNGNATVWGSIGTTSVSLGDGYHQIQLLGAGNTISLGAGSSFVDAGAGGNEQVTIGGGTNYVTLQGANNVVTLMAGTNTVVATASKSTFTAVSGSNTIYVQGTGNTITGGSKDDSIIALDGGNTMVGGTGVEQMRFANSTNVVLVGKGRTYLYDSGNNNTIRLAPAGSALTDIYGSVMTNGDKFDLRTLLSGTTWNGAAADVSRILSFSTLGSDALLTVKPGGTASGSYIAVDFHGSGPIALTEFLARSIF